MKPESNLKRQNFNVDPDQEAILELSREMLNAPTIKDAVLRSANIVNSIGRELKLGKKLMIIDKNGESARLMIPDMESGNDEWTYLSLKPHPWKKQLSLKGHRLYAATLWYEMLANNMSVAEIAEDRDLPLDAVAEAIRYCEANRDLIEMEAREERLQLLAAGIDLGA